MPSSGSATGSPFSGDSHVGSDSSSISSAASGSISISSESASAHWLSMKIGSSSPNISWDPSVRLLRVIRSRLVRKRTSTAASICGIASTTGSAP